MQDKEIFALMLNLNRMYGMSFWLCFEPVNSCFPELTRTEFHRLIGDLLYREHEIYADLKEKGLGE